MTWANFGSSHTEGAHIRVAWPSIVFVSLFLGACPGGSLGSDQDAGGTDGGDGDGGSCTPATCQSLGHECGQPSDGCGVSLDCGGCSAGEACNRSGQCVTGSNWWEVVPEPDGTNTGPNCAAAGCPSATLLGGNAPPGTITTPGQTYENFTMIVNNHIQINASNTTFRNFYIRCDGQGDGVCYKPITIGTGVTGTVFEYGEIDGVPGVCNEGLQGQAFTMDHMEIHNCDDAIKVGFEGAGAVVVTNSWFHTMTGSHGDTIQWYPSPILATSQLFKHNSFEGGGTGVFSGVTHSSPVTITENWITQSPTITSGYAIQCPTTCDVTNNLFQRNGWLYGYCYAPFTTWAGNRYVDDKSLMGSVAYCQ